MTLADGRVLGLSSGAFDAIVELVAAELRDRETTLNGLPGWLLEQLCTVQGPGVGFLDLREPSPIAAKQFREAFFSAYRRIPRQQTAGPLLQKYALLVRMWECIARREPPEILASGTWKMAPSSGERRGPGWGRGW